MDTPSEQLTVSCPQCGESRVLKNYALVGVAHHARRALCRGCVDGAAWAYRMLEARWS